MRIAYVCADRGIPFLGFKGASVHAREITAALQRRGHSVLLACANLGAGNPAPELSAAEVLPADGPGQERFLRNFFSRTRTDVVLERYSLESGAARRASALLALPLGLEVNAPIVMEAARFRGLAEVGPALERERETFDAADAVLVVSRALERYVSERCSGCRVALVRNGAAVERFAMATATPLGLPDDALCVGFVGSMKRWHGVHELLKAFEAVAHACARAHLVLVGTGPEEPDLRRRAVASAHRGRIHFLGPVSHDAIPGIVAAFDVAAAPYQAIEDFYFCPLKVLEYMAAKRPIVFSEVGDVPELLDGAGVGVPAGDVAALGEAIIGLLADPERRQSLRTQAAARGREFTWGRAAEAVERALEAARSTPRPQAGVS